MAGRRKQSCWNPGRPNGISVDETLASRYFDLHYQSLALERRWSWDRFCRTCRVLKMTSHELASLVALPHRCVPYWARDKYLSAPRYRASLILLTMMEHRVLKNIVGDTIPNPMADVDAGLTTKAA